MARIIRYGLPLNILFSFGNLVNALMENKEKKSFGN